MQSSRGWWFTEDKSEITEERIQSQFATVLGYSNTRDAIGKHVDEEDSRWSRFATALLEVIGRQLGIDPRRVNDILKGRQNKSHGVWFCRADKNF